MKQTNDEFFLRDIADFCDHLEEYVKGVEKSDFLENRMLQDALVRKLELIGEAAKNLTEKIRKQYPSIPWREIMRMRDKVIHHYFKVDLDLVWKTVTNDVPKLKSEVESIIEKISSQ